MHEQRAQEDSKPRGSGGGSGEPNPSERPGGSWDLASRISLTPNNVHWVKKSDSEFLVRLQTAFYLVCQLPPEKDGRVLQFKTWDCIQRLLLRYDSGTEREVSEQMSHDKPIKQSPTSYVPGRRGASQIED